tara:strand:+ start:2631 stop:2861 length:231 start_codon:yes stop_codon:yes gene_type:complete
MNERTSFITIFQNPSIGSFLNLVKNHLICPVLFPGGAYVFTRSIKGGAISNNLSKNGTIRSNKYASQGDSGGTLGN